MYAVCVTFHINARDFEHFLPLVKRQAATSLAEEPACHVFDVCVDPDGQQVFLYELYDDAAAFQLHLQSAHFKQFDADVAAMVAQKQVQVFKTVCRGGAQSV